MAGRDLSAELFDTPVQSGGRDLSADLFGDKPETSALQDIKNIGKKALQGYMNTQAGLVRGAGSIGNTILSPLDYAARAVGADNDYFGPNGAILGRTDRREAMDQALQSMGAETDSFGYGAGKLTGEILGTAGAGGAIANGLSKVPAIAQYAPSVINAIRSGGFSTGAKVAPGALPFLQNQGVRALGGAITGGTSAAMVNPEDAGTGAVIGGVAPAVTKTLGLLGGAIGKQFRPAAATSTIAQDALDRGAPLGIADITDGKFTKAVRSVLNDAPLTGGIGAKQNAAKQAWFNKAVGETFDAAEEKLTPQVMDIAKKKMGAEFDRIWGGNVLNVDDTIMNSMSDARKNAAMLPKGERNRVLSIIDDFEGQIQQGADGQIVIPGDVANRYQSKIREVAENATGFLKNDMNNLRKDIVSAFNRSVSKEDAAALALNQSKYKAFKTVEPLLAKGEAGVAGREAGDIPASLLSNAVFNSYGSNLSKTELGKLSKIGSQFLVDRTPQTGGSLRAGIQNGAIGSILGLGAFSNPLAASAVIPAAMATNKALGSPMIARSLMNRSAAPASNGLLERAMYLGLPVTGAGLLSGQ